jgi:hypothetical protein
VPTPLFSARAAVDQLLACALDMKAGRNGGEKAVAESLLHQIVGVFALMN